jgi:Holliday junction DNA helicase RuvA subunit
MIKEVKGLVIRTTDIRESDRLITIFTEEEGVLSAMAQGARSLKSRKMSSTMQFCYSRFILYKKGEYYYVREAELIESFFDLRNSIEGLALAAYIADVLSDVTVAAEEKELFLKLITVSGVGPKMGISILASMSVEEFARSIATADVKTLSKVKGLGKKTAEKIVLELHGKISAAEVLGASGESVGAETAQPTAKATPQEEEAISALMGLGFTRSESAQAVKKAKDLGARTVEEIIMKALQGV